jgi:hypothetical protein
VRANLAAFLARGGNLDEAERLWQDCFKRYLDEAKPTMAPHAFTTRR